MTTADIRILLVDDEMIARDLFTGYILKTPGLSLAGVARDGQEALELLRSERFDLVLMDIDLPVFSGMEVLEKLDTFPYVIFITASGSHALEAFELGAVDYLHKPVSLERFQKSIARARNFFQEPGKEREDRGGIVVTEGGNHYMVPYRDIIYISAHDKHSVVHTLKRDFESNRLLGDLETTLPDKRFLRIHRQHIINLSFVSHSAYLIGGRYTVVLKDPDDTELTVSRGSVPAFKKALGMS